MPTTAMTVLLFLAFLCTTTGSPHRHLLHQPFFPVTGPPTQPTSQSPSPSPSPQPQTHKSQPKYPFSTTPSTQQKPFFPSYSTPPPPSPAILNTFPANISSMIFPHSQNSSTHRHVIITITVSLSLFFAAVLAAISAFVIYLRHPHHGNTKKPPGSDSLRLFPPDTAPSDATQKTYHSNGQRRTPNTSTELLYLGTLVNPRATNNEIASNSSDIKIGVTSSPPYQRLGSPELKPLPPLPRLNYLHSSFNSAEVEGDSDTEEEFFSPRGSSGRKENLNLSPIQHVSASRTEDQVLQGESSKFGSRSFNSRTASCPYSNPYSSSNSVSTNPSPASNVSPGSLKLRPSDSVIDFPDPRQAVNLSPTSMSSSSLPSGIDFGIAQISQEINGPTSTREPPPPPPFPPARFWEVPVGTRQPAFVTQPRHVVFQNLTTPGLAIEQLQTLPENVGSKSEETTPKLKLKPLHWDKVRASSDRVMVWDQIKSSSFKLNEEMIETLFVVNNTGSGLGSKEGNLRRQVLPIQNQENRVLDPKKSQNIAILLRALNVTIDEVCEGLLEGNSDTVGTELLESLLKMAPTKEEERKLKEYKDNSPFKLGPAEKFLREVVDIPFAFKRVEAMLYIANFDSEVEYLRRSFETLQRACAELRNSKMFLKLLEAVLKTGNRMNVGTNRGDAHAFKLDTLLKLVDIKGTDGKTTLLHFVVQEIIRIEGCRISGANSNQTAEKTQQSAFQDDVEFKKLGLQVVSGLSGELTNVKKAATMDSDVLSSEVEKLASGISKITEVIKLNEEIVLKDNCRKFSVSMTGFLKRAEEEILKIQAHKREALALVKEITECFHGNLAKEEAHQFRIFMVVRDFLSILDQVCKEVGKINERSVYSSFRPIPVNSILPPIFPGISEKQQHGSSDDESSSSF